MEFNDLNGEIVLPRYIWSRKLDEEDPDNRIHMYSRPNFFETLILIPLAGRVSLYLFLERYNNREPIFDLRGILLKPPHPGPHAGCPLGGFGSGSIGLNFKGGMVTNRLSIHSGLIQYGSSDINNITIRIQRSDNQQIFIQHFHVENTLGNYHALFPRSWTNYESNVPNVSIIIGRLSPILPHSYSETCFPCGIFDVQVINGNKFDLDVSIMFTLQNMRFPIDGYNNSNRISDNNSEDSNMAADVTYIHKSFEYDHGNITGICLGSEDRRKDNEYNNNGMMDCCFSNSFASPLSANDLMKSNMDNSTSNGTHSMKYHQIQSYSIATQINTIYSDINNACISCSEYVDRDVLDHILTTNGDLSSNSQQSHQQSISTSTRSGNNYYQPSSALCHRIHIPSGTHRSVPFAISWDVPYAKLGTDQLPKYYTRFFGTSGLSAPEIAIYALKYYKGWTSKIELWHQDLQSTNVVEDEREHSIPTYYRYQLFNELYFLVEGSLWLDTCGGVPNTTTTTTTLNEMNGAQDIKLNERLDNRLSSLYIPEQNKLHLHDSLCNSSTCGGNQQLVGQFLLIEGFEYLMLNTTDVAFYSSFALIKLWPQLELSIQYDVAQCIGEEDNRMRVTLGEGTSVVRKKKNSVPHDLGSSSDGVFRPGCCNSYCFQDVSRWKDLGPKFILQVYRDFVLTKNDTFLHKMYNRMCEVMEYIAQFDPTGEGMIMNEGFPDQTYDIWTAKGISAYTGGLYVASCQAMTAAATVVGDKKRSIDYNIKAAKARVIYLQTLWNGMYLNYDSSTSEHSTSIMADMCCGHWYSRVCNLPGILPPMVLISCLETIFLHNVLRFGEGHWLGAVNGYNIRTNCVDTSCLQSKEVWTGTTYALAATFLTAAADIEAQNTITSSSSHENYHDYEESHVHWQNTSYQTPVVPSSEEPFTSISTSPLNKSPIDRVWQQAIEDASTGVLKLPAGFHLSTLYQMPVVTRLQKMGFITAQGIHDAGWCRFGYHFSTPEGWEKNGNYRSLGYSRPLVIWAIQHAINISPSISTASTNMEYNSRDNAD